jgi:putative Mg2+ transporter-C (MgtC) family protein
MNSVLSAEHWQIFWRLAAALVAGSLIGLERTRRGRHAGLREHALVCLGACQLMLLGVYAWTEGVTPVAFDGGSERIIQGLMTGVGFIGAGGIIKEGFSVRGITTASSLWVTTSIGVLVGLGFFFPAAVTTVLTLAALVMMRWWEERIRSKHELQLHLRQAREGALHEPAIKALLAAHGCDISSISAYGAGEGRFLDYRAVVATPDRTAHHALIETLANEPRFIEFGLTPLGE